MQLCLFSVASPIPDDARPVPHLDGEYLITPAGEVWSHKWDGPRRMRVFAGPTGPRVCLWRFGRRWRPDVATLIRQTFGIEREPAGDGKLIKSVLEEYGDDPAVLAWAESL